LTDVGVEAMLVNMIQFGDLGPGTKIDQMRGFVIIGESDSVNSNSNREGTDKGSIAERKAKSMGAWADALKHINNNMLQSLS